MTLSEVRELVAQRSGRWDLINSDGSDNGLDAFIRQAIRFLDLNVDRNDFGWATVRATSGQLIVPVPSTVRTILKAYVTTGGERSEVTIKRKIDDVLQYYAGDISDVDQGTISKLVLIGGKISPKLTALYSTLADKAWIGDDESGTLMENWNHSSQAEVTTTTDDGDDVVKVKSLGDQTDPAIVVPYLYMSTAKYVTYELRFFAKGIANNVTPQIVALGATVTAVKAPALQPYYQEYVYKITTGSSYAYTSIPIYIYPFGTNTGSDAPANSIVYFKDTNVRAIYSDVFPNHNMPNDYKAIQEARKHILVYPPPEDVSDIELYGRMFSYPLQNDDDENFWSIEYPDLLVLATCYSIEAALRNTQGMQDWLAAMEPFIRGIQADYYESEQDIINKMEG